MWTVISRNPRRHLPEWAGMLNEYVGRWLLLGCAVTSLAGCGKEIGRVPFSSEGTAAPTLELAAGDVGFWTDIDLKYEGPAVLEYHVDLQQGGATIGSAICHPLGQLNVKLGWVETHFGAASSLSGTGKMACSATISKAGPTTVQTTLAFTTRPAAFALKRADLVLKQ